ncbi:MAG: hypothetical protein WCP57_10900 [Bacteroidota bacterium]
MKATFYAYFCFLLICMAVPISIHASSNTIVHTDSFDYYIPKAYAGETHYPMIVFCDPYGHGSIPLEMYKGLADSFEYILVGSNFSQNGVDILECEKHIERIVLQMQSNYLIDEENITICGFSGGSYIAYHMAHFTNLFKNIIITGTPIRPIPKENYPNIFCIAGKGDMNYSDLMDLDNQLKKVNYSGKYFTMEYPGKHEWPDANTFSSACMFIYSMQCYTCKIGPMERIFLEQYSKKTYTNLYDKAMDYKKIIFLLDSTGAIEEYKKNYTLLCRNPEYTKIVFLNQMNLQKEKDKKQAYLDQFKVAYDSLYWIKEVNQLRDTAHKTSNQLAMDERLLGFLSLLGYSYTNRLLNGNMIANTPLLLNFYNIVDPTNPDVAYLSAIYFAKINQADKALKSLQEAVDKGYSDKAKMKNEPAFASLQTNTSFTKILEQMK